MLYLHANSSITSFPFNGPKLREPFGLLIRIHIIDCIGVTDIVQKTGLMSGSECFSLWLEVILGMSEEWHLVWSLTGHLVPPLFTRRSHRPHLSQITVSARWQALHFFWVEERSVLPGFICLYCSFFISQTRSLACGSATSRRLPPWASNEITLFIGRKSQALRLIKKQ